MGFLRRVFGRTDDPVPTEPDDLSDDLAAETDPDPAPEPPPVILATCPYCAYPLDPPPERNRRCPSCRNAIVVRRTEGRPVYLTEDAVVVFDRERQRIVDEQRWTAERDGWLALAAVVHADANRREHLARAAPSEEAVTAARDMYTHAADEAARTARGAKRWNDVARIRREQAAALFRAAGNPVPSPEDIAALHRDGMLAELRALAVAYKDAELVGAGCCRPCRVGDGKAFKIADELRTPRLPHDGCPKGLCACEWWLAIPGPKKRRRTRRAAATPEASPTGDGDKAAEPVEGAPPEAGTDAR